MKIVLNTIIWVAIVTLFYSCQSTPAIDLDSKVSYRYDARLKVNKQKGIGFMVVDKAQKYKIEVNAKAKIDLLTVRNCHRELAIEQAFEDNGIFKGKKYAEIEITPNNPIENEYCPMFVTAFDIKGRHSFALIGFRDDKFKLFSIVNCNGDSYTGNSVSGCLARTGTYQEIKLPSESIIRATTSECELDLAPSAYFRYEIKDGVCVYAIREISTGKMQRFTTLGYTKIILKE